MKMFKYIVKRILMLIPVLLGVSIIVFLIMRVFSPDPAPIVLGQHATIEDTEAWREANGLNDPIYIQYFNYIKGALTGDLGNSYYTKTPVTQGTWPSEMTSSSAGGVEVVVPGASAGRCV